MKSVANFLTALQKTAEFAPKSEVPAKVILEPVECAHYAQDWSASLTPQASAVIFPTSTYEVSICLKLALEHGVSIVPSGGRTGLSGGAVATGGEVVLSLTRLNWMKPVQVSSMSVQVGAGAITEAVHEHCKPYGLTWPVDFASKGSSTVGGNLATNAGGVRVIRYGNTRQWVLGITAVTMDGAIHHFNGELEKNNTGYDFRQLLIGSEGTLAVITEATLKLAPLPASQTAFLFALPDLAAVLRLFKWARPRVRGLSAFEYLDQACMNSVLEHFGWNSPFQSAESKSAQAFVLMEVENTTPDECSTWLGEIFEQGLVLDGLLADQAKDFQKFWQFREGVAESILAGHRVHQEDVSVPVAKLPEFYASAHERYARALPGMKIFFFGHIGDGNLHIFIQKPESLNESEFYDLTHRTDLELFQLLKTLSGSVSAEHGIGLLKKHALSFSRTPAEITLMKGLKLAFDPKRLLNPGKIFD
jgi:FAD/FMN-containing dehydrogenase